MLEFIIGLPFLVEDHGRINGAPYTLPHNPGERTYGLVPGWYYWLNEPAPGNEPEGPFNTLREAREDYASNCD